MAKVTSSLELHSMDSAWALLEALGKIYQELNVPLERLFLSLIAGVAWRSWRSRGLVLRQLRFVFVSSSG